MASLVPESETDTVAAISSAVPSSTLNVPVETIIIINEPVASSSIVTINEPVASSSIVTINEPVASSSIVTESDGISARKKFYMDAENNLKRRMLEPHVIDSNNINKSDGYENSDMKQYIFATNKQKNRVISLGKFCEGRYEVLAHLFHDINTNDLPFLTKEDIINSVPLQYKLLTIRFVQEKLNRYLIQPFFSAQYERTNPEDVFLKNINAAAEESEELIYNDDNAESEFNINEYSVELISNPSRYA